MSDADKPDPAHEARPKVGEGGTSDAASVQLENVTRRLQRRFGQIPAAQIATIVKEEAAEYIDARIRDFVPVLVERQARRRLEQLVQRDR